MCKETLFNGRRYNVYVCVDNNNNVIAIDNKDYLSQIPGWVKIDSGFGDKYHHAQGNFFPKPIKDVFGVCRYKIVNEQIVEKTDEEMIAERPTPTNNSDIERCIKMCETLQESVDKIKKVLKI